MEFAWNGIKVGKYKPIIIVAIITITIIVIAYVVGDKYIYNQKQDSGVINYDYQTANLDYIVTNASGDNDGDGMENWKENLLNTDPNAADAPMATAQAQAGAKSKASSTDINLTDEVARSIYTVANSMRSAGDTSTPSMVVVSNAIAEQALAEKPITIDENKIMIKSDTSRESLKTYGNELFGYIILYYPKVDESQVLDKYYKSNNSKVLKDLQSNVDLLTLMQQQLYKVQVPKNAYTLHVKVITHVTNAIAVEKALMKADSDALTTMVAFKKLREMGNSNKALMQEAKTFFDQNNVVFGPKDAGSIINQ